MLSSKIRKNSTLLVPLQNYSASKLGALVVFCIFYCNALVVVYAVITVQMAFDKLQIRARELILATAIHSVACQHIKGYRRKSPRVMFDPLMIRYHVRVIRNRKKSSSSSIKILVGSVFVPSLSRLIALQQNCVEIYWILTVDVRCDVIIRFIFSAGR